MKTVLLSLLTDLLLAAVLELVRHTKVSFNPFILSTQIACLEITLTAAGLSFNLTEPTFN
jgi:hypothetical protein